VKELLAGSGKKPGIGIRRGVMKQDRVLINIINEFLGDKEIIAEKDIDDFIIMAADYFYAFLTEDMYKRDRNKNFKNMNTKRIFDFGVRCMDEGINCDVLEVVLPVISHDALQNGNLTNQEIMEIKLMEKLLLLIQKGAVKEFLIFINYVCSSGVYSLIYQKFSKLKDE